MILKILFLTLIISHSAFANKWIDMGCMSSDANWSVVQNLGNNRYEVRSTFAGRLSRYVVELKTIKVKNPGRIFPYWALRESGTVEMQMKNGFPKKFTLFKESVECAKLVAKRNLEEYQYTLPKISDVEYNKIKKEHEEYDRKRKVNHLKEEKSKKIDTERKQKKQRKENKELNKLFE